MIATVIAVILLSVSMDIVTGHLAFKEAWGYSQKGYKGIWDLVGQKRSHSIWTKERVFYCASIAVAIVSGYLLKIGWDLPVFILAICASWGGRFFATHQYFYNRGMVRLGVKGYSIGIEESRNTDSKMKSGMLFKIIMYILGVVILVVYLTTK